MKRGIYLLGIMFLYLLLNTSNGYPVEYYALLVGIEDYQNISDLNYCVDDVVDMKITLVERFINWNTSYITILTNDQATKSNIKTKLQEMKNLNPDDVFLFYFSGHGSKDNSHSYLCPWDTDLSNFGSMISDGELRDWINQISAKKVIILDACHSGGMTKGGLTPKGISTLPPDFIPASGGFQAVLSSITNGVAFLACKADEYSYENDDLENGVFPYYLVEVIYNRVDNNIDFWTSGEEIFSYAKPKTTQYVSEEYGDDQHPQIKDNYSGELKIGYGGATALTEGIMDASPALMDIDGDETQEVFLACDDGDGDGKGKAYAYTADWNLMWAKKEDVLVNQNLKKSREKIQNKKLKIGLQYERLFLFSSSKKETFIGVSVDYLFSKNFGSYLTCLYTSKLSPNYTGSLPICNVAYLGRAVLLKTGISYRIHFLYTSIGCILGRITHIWGPKKGEKYYYPLPIQLGLEASMGAEFNVWGPCIIDIGVGIQKLEIKDSIMQFYEPYSLNGINFKVGVKVIL